MASLLGIFRLHHDHDHLHLFGGARRSRRHPVAPVLFVSIQMGSDHRAESLRRHHHRRLRATSPARSSGGWRSASSKLLARPTFSVPYKDGFASLVLVLFLVFRPRASSANGSRRKHERPQREHADHGGAPRAKPLLLRHLPYFIGAAILVALAATCGSTATSTTS